MCIHAVMAIWCLPWEGGEEPNRGRVEVREVKCGGGGYVMLCRLFPTAAPLLSGFTHIECLTHTDSKNSPLKFSYRVYKADETDQRVCVSFVIADPV